MKKSEQWIATYIATIKHYYDLIEELKKDSYLFINDRAEYNKLYAHYMKKYKDLIDEFEERYCAYMYA